MTGGRDKSSLYMSFMGNSPAGSLSMLQYEQGGCVQCSIVLMKGIVAKNGPGLSSLLPEMRRAARREI